MRPYFFKRPAITEDPRAIRYRDTQRRKRGGGPVAASSLRRGRGIALALLSIAAGLTGGPFGARQELAAWLRADSLGLPPQIVKAARDKAITAAREKRARRRARNLRWWANDRTWEFYGRAR